MERGESFTLDRGKRRAGGRLSYVKLGNFVISGKNTLNSALPVAVPGPTRRATLKLSSNGTA
jgi:hypothetical protein